MKKMKRVTNVRKKKSNFKLKFFLLLFLIASFAYTKNASADKDVESMLTTWFQKQQNESFQGMEVVLNEEKERLLHDLSLELKNDLGQTKQELNQYSQEEVEKRILELRNYAEQLKSNLKNSNADVNPETFNQLDEVVNNAMKQLLSIAKLPQNSITIPSPTTPPLVEPVQPTPPLDAKPPTEPIDEKPETDTHPIEPPIESNPEDGSPEETYELVIAK